MNLIRSSLTSYIQQLHTPSIRWTDIVEILIIAFLIYHIIMWVKNTRAYALLKGVLVIIVFVILAALFNMTTILWIVQNVTSIAVRASAVVGFAGYTRSKKPPKGCLFQISSTRRQGGRFSDHTVNELVRACTAMAKVKTGALIVIEQDTPLQEYERTGIDIDAVLSSQLLINIFEKNTPLHDGAVIVRGDRVVSATCYLPLSDNKLDKDLGTRHRAGVGISEVSDSLTLIVSEETGQISIAYKGKLARDVSADELRARLVRLQNKTLPEDKHGVIMPWKGKEKDEE